MRKYIFYILTFFTCFNSLASICTPTTTAYCCGFGIRIVTLNTINNATLGSDGYKDYSSTITTSLYAGSNYTMTVDVSGGSPGKQNVRAWIDFNNNNMFDSLTEEVFSANSKLIATGTVSIPANAVKNTPLRLRISADYDLNAAPTPCKNVQYGQVEDYGVIIINNPFPPNVFFSADKTTTCDGIVSFTDLSGNAPTGWLWNFGDGATSTSQNPVHTYTTNGTYSVKLTASNTNGSDKDSIINYIKVTLGAAPITASCSPATLGYCCQYGITQVIFHTINHSSPDGSEGYKDNSCAYQAKVLKNTTYPIQVKTGTLNPHDVKVYIDYDNNGNFTTNELVFTSLNQNSPSGNIAIPTAPPVVGVPLRMRVMADYAGSTFTSCTNLTYGQTEDYTILISDPSNITEINKRVYLAYPNPTSDILYISTSEKIKIRIMDTNNKIIYDQTPAIENDIYSINIDFIKNSGFYYLQFEDAAGNISTQKLCIIK